MFMQQGSLPNEETQLFISDSLLLAVKKQV